MTVPGMTVRDTAAASTNTHFTTAIRPARSADGWVLMWSSQGDKRRRWPTIVSLGPRATDSYWPLVSRRSAAIATAGLRQPNSIAEVECEPQGPEALYRRARVVLSNQVDIQHDLFCELRLEPGGESAAVELVVPRVVPELLHRVRRERARGRPVREREGAL